jgi:tripartite-type tricarboxylate transporter receptor subunit TctC
MPSIRIGVCHAALLCVATTGWVSAQDAKTYPTRPVRILVGFAAGGGTDVVARMFAQRFGESMGQTFLVDNRPGAGGNIAGDMTAKAAPDGHTLTMVVSSHAMNKSLYAKLPFDPVRDFAPVSLVVEAPNILVAHPAVPVSNLRDVIALAKAKPGQLTYSSSGNGTPTHLAMELFRSMAGIQLLHVPYSGGAPGVAAALSGEVQMHTNSLPTALPHVKSGKLRALGVTSAERTQIAPDIPTVAEAGGLPGFEATIWYGLLAPAGTPMPVVRKLNAETERVLQLKDVRDRLVGMGFDPLRNSPEAFLKLIEADVAKWAKVVREAGLRLD